jgi:hypothetical protein
MKINILGTEYEIIRGDESNYPKLEGCNGYTEVFTKKIVVVDRFPDGKMKADNVDTVLLDKTLRHEIVHAFLYESGLYNNCDWANNEIAVDWIALQIPKMTNVMKNAGCLEV